MATTTTHAKYLHPCTSEPHQYQTQWIFQRPRRFWIQAASQRYEDLSNSSPLTSVPHFQDSPKQHPKDTRCIAVQITRGRFSHLIGWMEYELVTRYYIVVIVFTILLSRLCLWPKVDVGHNNEHNLDEMAQILIELAYSQIEDIKY